MVSNGHHHNGRYSCFRLRHFDLRSCTKSNLATAPSSTFWTSNRGDGQCSESQEPVCRSMCTFWIDFLAELRKQIDERMDTKVSLYNESRKIQC
ncbi:hypothetical protein Mapa_017121 [Marchantia paleacea]|nr:hypothetical protein Mapa_017121 [Marchantia paleacea]